MANCAYPNPNTTHTQMSTFVCPKYTKAHFFLLDSIPHIHNGKLCISLPQHHTYTNVHFCVPQIHKSPLVHVLAPTPHIHNGKLCISQPQHHTYTNVYFCVSQIHQSSLLRVLASIPHIHNDKLCISQPQHHSYTNVHFCVSQIHKNIKRYLIKLPNFYQRFHFSIFKGRRYFVFLFRHLLGRATAPGR